MFIMNRFLNSTLKDNTISDNLDSLLEYQVSINNLQLYLGIANSAEQYRQIYQLRESVYQNKMSYLLNTESDLPSSADKFAELSYLFYCRQDNSILASCRYTPSLDGKWESSRITDAADLIPTDKTKMLQIGRLVVTPEYRSQLLSEILVWSASQWLKNNTEYEFCYGVCVPALVRFYRHFGVRFLPKTKIVLPERQNKSYRIVYGSIADIAQTLEQYIIQRSGCLSCYTRRYPPKIYFEP